MMVLVETRVLKNGSKNAVEIMAEAMNENVEMQKATMVSVFMKECSSGSDETPNNPAPATPKRRDETMGV